MFKLRWRMTSPSTGAAENVPTLVSTSQPNSDTGITQDDHDGLKQHSGSSIWASMMRMLRNFGRLRLLITIFGIMVTLYVFGQLRSTDELDDIGSRMDDIQSNQNQQAQPVIDNGMSFRKFKSNYNVDQYEDTELVYYKKDIPLIWVGGIPRSGTTLMRVMLDAHKDVRCGEETRVIPRLLSMHVGMTKSQKEMERLMEAKITEGVLDNALAAYILSIIAQHGEMAPRLCNKDPFTLKSMAKVLDMFPNSKFLFMIRDGRATVHSIISRHVTIKGFDIQSYRGGLQDWNRAIESIHNECEKVGSEVCMPVYYEQLVLHPRAQMIKILKFLDIEWDEMVIHHEKTINKTGGASLSGKELSTDQVERPINTEALTGWVSYIPPDVRKDMHKLAPMLHTLGYDPFAYPPKYGEPDQMVRDTDTNLKLENNFYQHRKPKVEPEDGKHRPPNRFVVNGYDPHGKAYGVHKEKDHYNKLPRH